MPSASTSSPTRRREDAATRASSVSRTRLHREYCSSSRDLAEQALAGGGNASVKDGPKKRKRGEVFRQVVVAAEDSKAVVKRVKEEGMGVGGGAGRKQAPAPSNKQGTDVTSCDEDDEQGIKTTPKSIYTGVHWNRRKRKWRVRIKANGRDTHVGYFNDEEAAAKAFDRAIVTYSRASSDLPLRLNFPHSALAETAESVMSSSESDREGVNMILAASQSPPSSREAPSGLDTETPPPQTASEMVDIDKAKGVMSQTPVTATNPVFTPQALQLFHPPAQANQAQAEPAKVCTAEAYSNVFFQAQGENLPTSFTPPATYHGGHAQTPDRSCQASLTSPAANTSPPAEGGSSSAPRIPSSLRFPSNVMPSGENVVSTPVEAVAQTPTAEVPSVSKSGNWSPFVPPGNTTESPTGSHACSSPSSLCDEGELEALKGLVELAGVCELQHTHATQSCQEGVSRCVKSGQAPEQGRKTVSKRKSHADSEGRGGTAGQARGWLRTSKADTDGGKSDTRADRSHGDEGVEGQGTKRSQSFRGVTWDKMKKMWRVRVCLAGGGREHVGYFLNEREGALAYTRALSRIRQVQAPEHDKSSQAAASFASASAGTVKLERNSGRAEADFALDTHKAVEGSSAK